MASNVVKALAAWKPERKDALREVLQRVGGLRRFVQQEAWGLAWQAGDCPGKEILKVGPTNGGRGDR